MRAILLLLCLCACACACAAGRAPAPSQPPAVEPAALEPVTLPAPALPELYELDPARTPTTDDILLQLDYEGGMLGSLARNSGQPFGRMPSFTLYRDGTVVFSEGTANGDALRIWTMPACDATRHIEHAWALGVARLRDHTHHCVGTGRRSRCVSDSPIRVLRARLPDGSLRELRNYAGFASHLMERLHAIYDRITAIEALYSGAPLYLPRGATLFAAPIARKVADLSPRSRGELRPWPLDSATLERALVSGAVALEVPQIRAMIAATGSNVFNQQLFEQGGRVVYASMVPWLPDADYREAIGRAAGGG